MQHPVIANSPIVTVQELLRRVASWLRPGGLLFVHIFVENGLPYHFLASAHARGFVSLLSRRPERNDLLVHMQVHRPATLLHGAGAGATRRRLDGALLLQRWYHAFCRSVAALPGATRRVRAGLCHSTSWWQSGARKN